LLSNFSKMCQKCNTLAWKMGTNLRKGDKQQHRCAKNWDQSSKAMELHGKVQCVTDIWESGKAWLHVFLSDDDSSSHAALHHSIETRMKIEKQMNGLWTIKERN